MELQAHDAVPESFLDALADALAGGSPRAALFELVEKFGGTLAPVCADRERTAILGQEFVLRTISSRLSILSLAALLVGCGSTSDGQMGAGGSGGQGAGTGGVSGVGGTNAGTGGWCC